MLEIFVYGIGVMYSPGPVNLIAFNEGIRGNFRTSIGFFAGVGIAMFVLCFALGYAGQFLVTDTSLPIIALIGCVFILYLAYKILRSSASIEEEAGSTKRVQFTDGFFIQLFNPKAMLALVPITTIQFPAANITGVEIALFSAVIGLLAMWAPGSYSFFGSIVGKALLARKYLQLLNTLTGLLLIIAAVAMFYSTVYLAYK